MGDSSRRTTYTRRITAADRSSVEVMGKQAPTVDRLIRMSPGR
jgi:hypothetical protein